MSKKLLPRRDSAEIASELFRSCQWEVAGDVARAAHKAAYYIFHELIKRLGVDHKRRQELVDYIATSTEADKIQMARRELEFGVNRAKYIFGHFGKLPLKTEINERKNNAVLDRFDRGVWDPEPSVVSDRASPHRPKLYLIQAPVQHRLYQYRRPSRGPLGGARLRKAISRDAYFCFRYSRSFGSGVRLRSNECLARRS
jgi:hypothetical protein